MKKISSPVGYLENKKKPFLMLLGTLFLVLVWFIDYLLGWKINFSPGYLLPIIFVTWFISAKAGLVIAVVSGFLRFITIIFGGSSYPGLAFHGYNVGIRLIFFVSISNLLAKLKILLEREKYFGRIDYLTGLANKRQFDELSNIEIARFNRYKHIFTMVYMDIDYFKNINDRFGHHAGNMLLMTTAKIIKKNIRTIDVAARIGGDEFTILMPETDQGQAEMVVNRLQKSLMDAVQKNKWPVMFSFGVVIVSRKPDSVNDILKLADKLMYSSKFNGSGKITYGVYNG